MTNSGKREKRTRVIDESHNVEGIYDIALMAMMTYTLPRPIAKVDAIVVYPGMGEASRVMEAVSSWERSTVARHFLIAGVYDIEDTFEKITIESLSGEPYNLKKKNGVVIQETANHTKDQADWVAKQTVEKKFASIALFAPAYHLLRAYATTLKSLQTVNETIPIIPMPIQSSPNTRSSETGMDMWEMSPAELQRITRYQGKGDVSMLTELKDYINWSWEQSIYRD